MTIYAIISWILRFIGFAQAADAAWQKHETVVKAQKIADVPATDAEWTAKAKDGEL